MHKVTQEKIKNLKKNEAQCLLNVTVHRYKILTGLIYVNKKGKQ